MQPSLGPVTSCPVTTRQGDQCLREHQYVIPRRRHGQVNKVHCQAPHITTEYDADSRNRIARARVSLHVHKPKPTDTFEYFLLRMFCYVFLFTCQSHIFIINDYFHLKFYSIFHCLRIMSIGQARKPYNFTRFTRLFTLKERMYCFGCVHLHYRNKYPAGVLTVTYECQEMESTGTRRTADSNYGPQQKLTLEQQYIRR